VILTPARIAELREAVENPKGKAKVSITGEGPDGKPFQVVGLLQEELRALLDSHEELRTHGTPGVMHEVDQAFYDLAVKERDAARALLAREPRWNRED